MRLDVGSFMGLDGDAGIFDEIFHGIWCGRFRGIFDGMMGFDLDVDGDWMGYE